MKFSIQEEEEKNKSFSHSKKHQKKQDFPPKAYTELLSQEETNISEDAIKKLFGFRMKKQLHLFRLMEKIFSPRRKFMKDLEFLEQFCLINFAKRKLTSWILRRNLMK